ncbi:MAG: hypothetical protein L6R19_20745 [Alphaproteobacteria bacterium]|nr:hypothetical protein [Alphaproteobacteria bacterium]
MILGIGNAEPIGSLFFNGQLGPGYGGGTTINQVISPADNTNGLIIRTMNAILHIGGTNTAGGLLIYADTTAPSSYYDAARRIIWHAASKATTNPIQMPVQSINYPLAIPKDLGIWATVSGGPGTDVGAASLLLTGDVLTLA